MSSEAAERLRAYYQSFRGQAMDRNAWHPNFEWHTRADLPDADVYRGYDEAERYIAGWTEAFEDLRCEPLELSDVSDKIVAVVRLHGRLRGSGEPVDMQEVHVWGYRDGKFESMHEYNTKEEALRSLGLAVE
jgi:ketosteroid isomerase-like protein